MVHTLAKSVYKISFKGYVYNETAAALFLLYGSDKDLTILVCYSKSPENTFVFNKNLPNNIQKITLTEGGLLIIETLNGKEYQLNDDESIDLF